MSNDDMIKKTLKKTIHAHNVLTGHLAKLFSDGISLKPRRKKFIKSVMTQGDVTVIRLKGDFTVDNMEYVQEEFVARIKGREIVNLLFDLKDVTDADSSSIATLIDLFRILKEQKKSVKIGLINVSKQIKSLLTISRTDTLFREYRTEGSAAKDLS